MASAPAAEERGYDGRPICLLSAEYPPARGGVGDYTRLLAAALEADGLSCCVLTSARSPAPGEEETGVPVFPRVKDWGFSAWRDIASFVREMRPAVVHIQYQTAAYRMHPAVNLLPWRLRSLGLRTPVVTTFHDLRPPYLFPKAGAARHLPAVLLAWASDAVVLVAREHWQEPPLVWLRRLRPSLGGKTHVIPIGSNIPAARPSAYDRVVWRARLGVQPDDLLLAYFGFINRSKGVDDLLHATRALVSAGRRVRVLFVGGAGGASNASDRAWAREVEGLVDKLSLRGLIRWTGYGPATEVAGHLLAADLCVLPFRDGATFQRGTLLAALAHGLPVISTRAASPAPGPVPPHGWSEEVALRHGENIWLVPPGEPDALAAAIGRLGEDEALRQTLAQGALRLASRLTWEAIAKRHRELYTALWRSVSAGR